MLTWILKRQKLENHGRKGKLIKDVYMKKYYVQSDFKYLVWVLSGLFIIMGVLMIANVGYEGLILILVALLFFGLGFVFNINKIYIIDDELHISFARLKKKIKIKDITSLRLYKGKSKYSFGQILVTLNKVPEVDNDIPMISLIKECKSEHIPVYLIGYNKCLIKELEKQGVELIRL